MISGDNMFVDILDDRETIERRIMVRCEQRPARAFNRLIHEMFDILYRGIDKGVRTSITTIPLFSVRRCTESFLKHYDF